MGLKSQLFTIPKPDPRLERCLVDDAGHITQGSRGGMTFSAREVFTKIGCSIATSFRITG